MAAGRAGGATSLTNKDILAKLSCASRVRIAALIAYDRALEPEQEAGALSTGPSSG